MCTRGQALGGWRWWHRGAGGLCAGPAAQAARHRPAGPGRTRQHGRHDEVAHTGHWAVRILYGSWRPLSTHGCPRVEPRRAPQRTVVPARQLDSGGGRPAVVRFLPRRQRRTGPTPKLSGGPRCWSTKGCCTWRAQPRSKGFKGRAAFRTFAPSGSRPDGARRRVGGIAHMWTEPLGSSA